MRSDNFPLISGAVKPFIPFSRMNPRITPSNLAQTTAMSQTGELVIHIFEPLRIYPSRTGSALVRIDPGSDPPSDSVRPKQPINSPLASLGKNLIFCSSEPNASIGYITKELCTDIIDLYPLSTRSTSRATKPYITWLALIPP